MNHDYIEQFDLIDRYLMGRLVAEESEQFQEHLIDCPQCIDRLKTARDFKQGLLVLTSRQASQKESYISEVSHWFFLQRKGWALAALGLLVVTTTISILLLREVRALRSEADQAKTASTEWQHRFEEQQQSAILSEQQRQRVERDLNERVQRLEEDLQKAEKHSADTTGQFRGRNQPSINLPIFVLKSLRESGQNPSEINTIRLSRSPMDFVFSMPLEGQAKFRTYRVTILKSDRPYWQSTGLKPDGYNAFTIGFNSSFFRAGKYVLVVDGITREGALSRVGSYPFQVIKN